MPPPNSDAAPDADGPVIFAGAIPLRVAVGAGERQTVGRTEAQAIPYIKA